MAVNAIMKKKHVLNAEERSFITDKGEDVQYYVLAILDGVYPLTLSCTAEVYSAVVNPGTFDLLLEISKWRNIWKVKVIDARRVD